MREFKIRCSAIGKIMTSARGGSGLGKTAQTYCKEWLKEQLYDRKKEFSNKYTQKGQIMEDDSIDLVADHLGYGMLVKNEEYFENDFMTGTPDVIPSDHVIDVKNSWDVFTFPLFETDVPAKDYWWQGQGYMHLTGKTKYKLIYTLTDTPAHLIEREARRHCWDNGLDELEDDVYQEFVNKLTYTNTEDKLKVKVFEFEADPSAIASIEQRVLECRDYIAGLKAVMGV